MERGHDDRSTDAAGATAGDAERRQEPRSVLDAPVQVTAGASSFPAHAKDISRLGMLLVSEVALEVGTLAHLAFDLPGEGRVELRAPVIRVEPCGEGRAMAVLFTVLPRATLDRLDAFVSRRSRDAR